MEIRGMAIMVNRRPRSPLSKSLEIVMLLSLARRAATPNAKVTKHDGANKEFIHVIMLSKIENGLHCKFTYFPNHNESNNAEGT
jgi:hypothetical protein